MEKTFKCYVCEPMCCVTHDIENFVCPMGELAEFNDLTDMIAAFEERKKNMGIEDTKGN